MHPGAFYDLAAHLVQGGPASLGEAARRTAASRAYYAALHLARDTMKAWGCSFGKEDRATHAKVIDGLQCSGHTELIKQGKNLLRLKVLREQADYELAGAFCLDWEQVELRYQQTLALAKCVAESGEEERRVLVRKMQAKIDQCDKSRLR